MARRKGTSSNRYRRGNDFVSRARQSSKDRRLKARNPDKYKRRKKVAKASADGKITKKEGQKLARKGVSLQKIRNRNISEYRQAGRDYDRRGPSERGSRGGRPGFEPLKIKRGAYEALSGRSRQPSRDNNKGNRTPDKPTGFVPTPLPTDFVDQPVSVNPIPYDGPSAEDMFRDQISDLESDFAKSLREQQEMYEKMRAEQQERMELLQTQMKQQAMAQRPRPELGVRTAIGSAGNAMQVARRGVSGAFGRSGMRISSLNI